MGWGRSVVTIGVFDGVHRGHQAIIGHAVKRARDLGLQSVVMTFDPHPAEVVRPGSHPAVLTEPVRKAELIEQLGVDALCVVPFTPAFSQLSPEAFVHDVLVEALHAAVVVVGDNFRFGHRAAGDVALLEGLGRSFGFTVEDAPLVSEDGLVFSSTYIRSCVDAGDVRAAAAALGRPHRLAGVVVRGDQRGREIGFPTANLMCHRYAAIPADGVYAAWLVRGGEHAGRLMASRLDRDEPDLLRPGAPGRGVRPGLRRRPVRRAGQPGLRRPPARTAARTTASSRWSRRSARTSSRPARCSGDASVRLRAVGGAVGWRW